ncbi:MAG: glycosyltransferase family 2 protein, partial [Mycoplasma sp.]|nr:glycosyltransferase family 2 protein [Mycoplasma sp.]
MIKSTNNIGILQDIYETKFFIIMPTYNVGYDLIKKCLLSIYCQKITCNIFLIIINDKSLKWNEEIKAIEEYKEKLNIYILENEKNIGLGPTRNIGLNYIKNNIKFSDNDYILYIDPDDFFKKNSLKKLWKRVKKEKYPDIVRFSYVSLKKNKAVINYYPVIFSSQNGTDKMWNGFLETSWLCAYNVKFIFKN